MIIYIVMLQLTLCENINISLHFIGLYAPGRVVGITNSWPVIIAVSH